MVKKVVRFIVRSIMCFILLIIGHSLIAQDISTTEKPGKKSDQYLGLQGNQLLRQLLNFGGTSGAVNNPYLITYSVNSKSTGFGLSAGLGYTYNQSQTGDGFSNTISTTDDFAFRIGFEDKTWFGKRWMASWGIDCIIDSDKTKTVATASGAGSTTTIETKSKGSGLGPRVTLNFLVHEKIVIGTEASYYLKFIKQEQKMQNTGITPIPDAKLKSFQVGLPAVIFVMLKF